MATPGNDNALFNEVATYLVKAEEHFERAKLLFADFKNKYPALAAWRVYAEPLNRSPGGNLYQRRMLARSSPGSSPLSAGSGYSGYPSSGMSSASYPSYAGSSFGSSPRTPPCPPRSNYLVVSTPQVRTPPPSPTLPCDSPMSFQTPPYRPRSKSPNPCPRPGYLGAYQPEVRTPPPPQPMPGVTSTPLGVQRRLFFGTPEFPKFSNMIGPNYFDKTQSSRSSGRGYSDLQSSSDESSILYGELRTPESSCSDELPMFYNGPIRTVEHCCPQDLDLDPIELHALEGGTPPPDSYYENLQNSPRRFIVYQNRTPPKCGNCGWNYAGSPSSTISGTPPRDPCGWAGQRGMEESMPTFTSSPPRNYDPCANPCAEEGGILNETIPEMLNSTSSTQ